MSDDHTTVTTPEDLCGSHGLPHPCEACAVESAYEEVLADHNRLVRELDVLLNGEQGAAKQASLCDIVSQVRSERRAVVEALEAGCDFAGEVHQGEWLGRSDRRDKVVEKMESAILLLRLAPRAEALCGNDAKKDAEKRS